jgi:hypothetical protein
MPGPYSSLASRGGNDEQLMIELARLSSQNPQPGAPTPEQNQAFMTAQGQAPQGPSPAEMAMLAGGDVGVSSSSPVFKDIQKRILESQKTSAERSANYDKELRGSIGQGEAALRAMLAQKTGNQTDFSPLAKLVDSWTGSKFSQGYKAPSGAEDMQLKVAGLQDKLQSQREKLADNSLNAGKLDLAALKDMLQMEMGAQKNATIGGFRQDARDERAHQLNLSRLKQDKKLGQNLNQYQNLGNALVTIEQADRLTPQQIDEFQQAVRANLGIKGTGGVEEREKTYFNSLGLNAARWQQFLTGNPAELARDSKMVEHFKQLASLERQNIEKQTEKRIKAVTAGNDSVYKRNSDLRGNIMSAIQATKEQFLQPAPAQAPGGAALSPAAAAPPVKGVISQKVLQDWATRHNKSVEEATKLFQGGGYGIE